ncbi:uncharacterized protein LOC135685567 [Rhopilema esculentum]|uniref:uncharacterized protein LOC135685567 n=1 Tax=Rhopilema esculentum TaxID=499914 RepID=UPI0031E1EBC8|eukprot:gene17334-8913_t
MAGLPDGSVFKGKKLLSHSGDLVDAEQALANKTVVVCYFSAHWCPPCRQFTPMLKMFYEDLEDSPLAIIFVSSDRDEASMKSYFADHGAYYAVPYSDNELSTALKQNCEVQGIPKLAVVDKSGKMLNGDGRSDVAKGKPSEAFKKWEDISKA